MNLTIKNVSKITDVSLNLKGINIIAGQNDTGKSSIGKSLFSLYAPNFKKEYENKTELVHETLKHDFYGTYQNVYTNGDVVISSSSKDGELTFTKELDNLNYSSEDSDTVVYIIDSFFSKMDKYYLDAVNNINDLNFVSKYKVLKEAIEDDSVTNEIYDEILVEFDKIFEFSKINNDVIKLNNSDIELYSLSSGIRNLYYVYKLVVNGKLNNKTILVLDEPEDELHPEWQLAYSNILVLINKLLGTRIILTTHSSEQIESIVTLMLSRDRFNELKLFMSKNSKSGAIISDCGADPQMLFESLNTIYKSLDELDV